MTKHRLSHSPRLARSLSPWHRRLRLRPPRRGARRPPSPPRPGHRHEPDGAIPTCRARTTTPTRAARRSNVRPSSPANGSRTSRPAELDKVIEARNARKREVAPGLGGRETGAGPIHWFEDYNSKNSRAWLVTDPQDGKVPPQTDEARQRAAAAAASAAAATASTSVRSTVPRICRCTTAASRAASPAR